MTIMTGVFRLGRDIEVAHTSDGELVGRLALAYNYGKKGGDGKRPTQWVDGTLYGSRVEKLHEYLTKGTAIFCVLEEVHVQTYEKRDGGTGVSLRGRIGALDFAGGGQQGERQERQERQPQAQPKPAAKRVQDLEDDDIPF